MKKKGCILLVLLSCLLTTSCSMEFNSPRQHGDIYLLSIALDYANTNVTTLKGTINDSNELTKAFEENTARCARNFHGTKFQQAGPLYGTEILTCPSYPSKDHLLSYLRQQITIASENDLTIISYSGHGDREKGSWLLGCTDEKTGRTICNGNINESQLLSPEELFAELSKIPGKKLIISDSCFCGNFIRQNSTTISKLTAGNVWKAALEKLYGTDPTYKDDIYVLCATTSDNTSHEPSPLLHDHIHGYFTKALLEGLGWCDGTKGQLENTIVPSAVQADGIQGKLSDGLPPACDSCNLLTTDSLYAYIITHQQIPLSDNGSGTSHQHPMTNGGRSDLILFAY